MTAPNQTCVVTPLIKSLRAARIDYEARIRELAAAKAWIRPDALSFPFHLDAIKAYWATTIMTHLRTRRLLGYRDYLNVRGCIAECAELIQDAEDEFLACHMTRFDEEIEHLDEWEEIIFDSAPRVFIDHTIRFWADRIDTDPLREGDRIAYREKEMTSLRRGMLVTQTDMRAMGATDEEIRARLMEKNNKFISQMFTHSVQYAVAEQTNVKFDDD